MSIVQKDRLTSLVSPSIRKRVSGIEMRSTSAVQDTSPRTVISVPKELERYLHSPFATEDDESLSLLRRKTSDGH